MFNPPSLRGIEPRKLGLGAWTDHVPFGYDLVAEERPRLLVELGTFSGESYFAFCQSIAENGVGAVCYAVDTWKGDLHTGPLAESAYCEVARHNAEHYRAFSYLVRATFDEAQTQFADGSIDLLHIDGLHTYEAAKHDYEHWLPKVRPGGVILFHDVVARHDDFGVWKLWSEIAQPGSSFLFTQGWGLGVLRTPATEGPGSKFLGGLLGADPERVDAIRQYYALVSGHMRMRRGLAEGPALEPATARPPSETKRLRDAEPESDEPTALIQVFISRDGQFSEEASLKTSVPRDRWTKLQIPLPEDYSGEQLRLDPGTEFSVIDIAGIQLSSKILEQPVWVCRNRLELASLAVTGTARVVPHDRFLRVLSLGNDPNIHLPALKIHDAGEPLGLDVWLRVSTSLKSLRGSICGWVQDSIALAGLRGEFEAASETARAAQQALEDSERDASQNKTDLVNERATLSALREELARTRAAAEASECALHEARLHLDGAQARQEQAARDLVELEAARQELGSLRSERLLAVTELNARMGEFSAFQTEFTALQTELQARSLGLETLGGQLAGAMIEKERALQAIAMADEENRRLNQELREKDAHCQLELGRRRSMQQSLSWKLTMPFRALRRLLRAGSFSPPKVRSTAPVGERSGDAM